MNMDAANWNEIIAAFPGAHLLQTYEWGEIKREYGWEPQYKTWTDSSGKVEAAALVLKKTVSLLGHLGKMSILYSPRGPLMRDWGDTALRKRVLDDLQKMAKTQNAIFIKMDPELMLGRGVPGEADARNDAVGSTVLKELVQRGWLFSDDQIQFRNTVWIDTGPEEDELLARMKQKTRYNIRLAARKGVTVRAGRAEDYPFLYQMYAETSVRDGFVIRSEAYYQTVWKTFMQHNMAVPLIAEVEGAPVAAVFLFYFAGKAWYLYGMSRNEHREKMPNYLLQWEAIKRARQEGCAVYDLWGAPDVFDETDSMWGVFNFKRGLAGEVIRTIGAWDYPSRPLAYSLYTQVLPKIMNVMRARGKKRTQQEVSE